MVKRNTTENGKKTCALEKALSHPPAVTHMSENGKKIVYEEIFSF
jgi:hypothetical protein